MKPVINFSNRLHVKDIISKLYEKNQFNIDLRNRNPYRIVLKEEKCTDIFYFSCPIFSYKSGKLVNCNWVEDNGKFVFEGINALLKTDGNSIILENQLGSCTVSFNKDINIVPTLNGVLAESVFSNIEAKLYFYLRGKARYNSSLYETDEKNNRTEYTYDSVTSLMKTSKKPGRSLINYEYYPNKQLKKMSTVLADGETVDINYGYDYLNNVNEIQQNGYKYGIQYDNFGNTSAIGLLGNNTFTSLVNYNYNGII